MQRIRGLLYSRLSVLADIFMIAVVLFAGVHLRGDIAAAWHLLMIPGTLPTFGHTRTITHSIDCLRVYSYPPIWLDLRYRVVTSRSTTLVALVAIAMTVLSFLLLFEARRWLTAVLVFLTVASTAVLFCMERGNCDLVVFSLLVGGFFLAERLTDLRQSVGAPTR